MPAWLPHIDSSILFDSLKSLLLLITLLITRALLVRSIAKNSTLSMEAKRRWVVATRNSILFALLIGLVVFGRTSCRPLPYPWLPWRPRLCWPPKS